MSRDDKVSMPSSGAGITRYFDESKSKIRLRPEYVVLLIGIIVLIILLLHYYGNRIFGIG